MPVTDVAAPTKSPTRLAPLDLTAAGVTTGLGAGAGNGIRFLWRAVRQLRVRNASGSPVTVSVLSPETGPDGQVMPPLTFTVGATTGDRLLPPIPARYADSAGRVTVEFSAITSVTYDLIDQQQA